MTKPISNERAQYLSERLKVVEKCIHLSQSQMHTMTGGQTRDDMFNALRGFSAERTAIAIELHVLKEIGVTP